MMLNRPTCGNAASVRSGGAAAGEPGRTNRWPAAAASMPRSQRPANDWTGFADNLREVVRLSRQEAQSCRCQGRLTLRRAAGSFEPDMTSARLDSLFADLKSRLPSRLSQAVEKQAKQTLIAPGAFPHCEQRSWACRRCVSLALTSTAGASTSAPTRSAAAYATTRITTRYNENDLLSALFGVIDEAATPTTSRIYPRRRSTSP